MSDYSAFNVDGVIEGGSGTVQTFSFVDANGFVGSVTSPMVNPQLTINTTVVSDQLMYSVSGAPTGDADLAWDDSGKILSVGSSTSSSDGAIIIGGSGTGIGNITGGGAALNIAGGDLTIQSNSGGSHYARIVTEGVDRLKITSLGEWQVNGDGGASGDILRSSGPGLPPEWDAIGSDFVTSVTATAPLTANGNSGTPETGDITVALETPLDMSFGGTSAVLSPDDGGIFYSTATTGAILSGTVTPLQMLQSGSSSAPSWSTTTWPATSTINQILYSSSNDVIDAIATNNNGILVTGNSGVPSILAGPGSNGRIVQSNLATEPSWSTAAYPSVATSTGSILRANGTDWSVTTASYPNTTATNQILYSPTTNVIGGIPASNNGVLISDGSGGPSWLGAGTTGQVLIGTTGSTASWGTLSSLAVSSITATAPLTANGSSGSPQTGAVTVALTTPLTLALGGTSANLTASNGGIFYSTASAGAILAGTATSSKMLLSGSSAAPTWSTSTIPTSAGATANKVLLSDGTNYVLSTPTFPNASATSGKFIRSDGTNWIASTPTLPTSASGAGTILRSDGTNWLSTTATYPNSTTANQILYSSASNTIGEITAAANGILITNNSNVPSLLAAGTTGQFLRATTSSPASWGTLTFNGNSGSVSVTGASVTYSGTTALTGASVRFSGTGSTITLNTGVSTRSVAIGPTAGNAFTAPTDCTLLGNGAGAAISTSSNCTFIGSAAGTLTTGGNNTGVGFNVLAANVAGVATTAVGANCFSRISGSSSGNSTGLGVQAGQGFVTGNGSNVCIGSAVGSGNGGANSLTGSENVFIGSSFTFGANSYTGSESSNIIIQNAGTVGDNNTIRIGTSGSGSGQQNSCFIAGTYNVTPGTAWRPIVINSSAQIGTATDTTGVGAALLGSNCPASNLTTPYTWIKMTSSDGSTVYVPAWK